MGKLLISSKSVKSNKALKMIQKDYLKAHKRVKGRYPKAKIGRVVMNVNDDYINCTDEAENNQDITVNGLSNDEIIEFIKNHDVRGMSGSGFPEYKKLEAVRDSGAVRKYFIVNAVACDPGLIHDAYLLKNHKADIERGIDIIKKCIEFDDVIIASPENVPARYPAGEEKVLCKNLLGLELSKEDIPAYKGVLVMNVQTVYNIAKVFKSVAEVSTKFITAADLDTGKGVVVKVKIGQSISEIAEKAGLDLSGKTLYFGGGVMDADEAVKDSVVSVHTNFIAAAAVTAEFDNDARCKGCGKCSRVCPKGVQVKKIIRAISKNKLDKIKDYGIDKCIECGSCSYGCAAGKDTMAILKGLRNDI